MQQEDSVPEETQEKAGGASAVLEEGPARGVDVAGIASEKQVTPLPDVKSAPPKEPAQAANLRAASWQDALAPGRSGVRPALPKRGPGVARYLVMLCLRPEQWPQAARYQLRLTLMALLLAVLLVGLGVGIRAGSSVLPAARAFVAGYDREHPELIYSQGKLAVSGDPQAAGKNLPKLLINGVLVVMDPTGKTTVQGMGERGILIDEKTLTMHGSGEGYDSSVPLKEIEERAKGLGWAGGEFKINGTTLGQALQKQGAALALGVGLGAAFMEVLGSTLWALVTAFLVIPMVQLVAFRLAMPRRVAFRVSLAVVVPLVVLDGVLKIAGFAVSRALSGEGLLIFWFGCAAALAAWAGWLANAEFSPKTRRGRAHG